MSLADALKKLKFDKRLIDNSLAKGQLRKEELEQYLKELPDVSGNIDLLNLDSDEVEEQETH